jgi:hypothetical protein
MTKISGRQRSEARRRIIISNPSVCYYCKSTGLTQNDKTCPNCGFPQNQGQAAMKRFIWNINNKHFLLNEYAESIDKAHWTLLGISILTLVMAIFLFFEDNKILRFSAIICSIIFFVIWHWSKSKPYHAIITGIIVFSLLLLITGILDPSTIADGGYGKILILGALYYGYRGIKKGQSLYAELESIKKAVDLNIRAEDNELTADNPE